VGTAAISILGRTGARDLRAMKMLVQTAGRGLTHALASTGPRQPISPRLPRAAPG
jgi:hypothetical protein